MRPLVARCNLGLARCYRRLGERDKAQEHLATAANLCRDLGTGFLMPQGADDAWP
jgi:hypothetical protein